MQYKAKHELMNADTIDLPDLPRMVAVDLGLGQVRLIGRDAFCLLYAPVETAKPPEPQGG